MGKTPRSQSPSSAVRDKKPARSGKGRAKKGPNLQELLVAFFPDPASWLATPNAHFGGRKPADLLGTVEEIKVYNLLRAVDMGSY